MKNRKGIFMHVFEDDQGEFVIDLQAELLGITDNVASLQLYSWVDGLPSRVIDMPMKDLISKNIIFYDNEKKWRQAASYPWNIA